MFCNLSTFCVEILLASLRKESPGCSGETAILQQNEGIFTSPNYGKGNTYPNAARCSWRIVVDPSMVRCLQVVSPI